MRIARGEFSSNCEIKLMTFMMRVLLEITILTSNFKIISEIKIVTVKILRACRFIALCGPIYMAI